MSNYLDIVNGTLAADTETVVTFPRDLGEYGVTNLDLTGASIIWVRHDGTAATVAGQGCKPVLPGQTVFIPRTKTLATGDGTEVSLISDGTPAYSVEFP